MIRTKPSRRPRPRTLDCGFWILDFALHSCILLAFCIVLVMHASSTNLDQSRINLRAARDSGTLDCGLWILDFGFWIRIFLQKGRRYAVAEGLFSPFRIANGG